MQFPFVEQVEHLTRPHARRTPQLQRILVQITVALAARLAASTTHSVDDLATAVAVLRDLLDRSDPGGSHL